MSESNVNETASEVNKNVETRKNFARSIREYWREYCENSSIQGFAHIAKDTVLIERLWWVVMFLLCSAGSIFMVLLILDKWVTTPVLVSFSKAEMPIHEIPFPAVTICPESKVSRTCLNYTDVLLSKMKGGTHSADAQQKAYFDYMALLCRLENYLESIGGYYNSTEPQTAEKIGNEDYSEFLSKCSVVNLQEAICWWMDRPIRCEDIMVPVMTDEGLCYSFNMYDSRDIYSDENTMSYFEERNRDLHWDPDNGYKLHKVDDVFPRPSFLSGSENSLVAVFYTRIDEVNYACRNFALQGIRVSLHTPSNIPRPSQVFFSVGLNRFTNVAVKPSLTITSSQIRQYAPEKRFCYFGHERSLKYFRMYSQPNCNMECWTNYTINLCGCVNFYMPRDKYTRVCNLQELQCLEEASKSYPKMVLEDRLDKPSSKDHFTKCTCLPLCSELTYSAEISASDLDFKNTDDLNYIENNQILDQYHASAVRIFMKSEFFLPFQRDELYGISDVVSGTGGVFGLFNGFSLFSIAEIIYYISVKLFENYRRHGHWAGPRTTRN
ncbi:hypothetical protein WA026_001534 [Henosepilachna vigintioctopunctata]|uniref:Uncharacterized protein n=1 Tax=Henosepilachna vigintioctopunctata TaxID=420089 RepID=A0AAW1UR98_9CUCU